MRARSGLASLFLLVVVGAVVAAAGDPSYLLQPPDSRDGLLLTVHGPRGRAATADGGADVFRLRDGETLTAVAETDGGWVAAGTRELDGGTELLLLGRDSRGTLRLPVPAGRRGVLRLRPQPLLERRDLAGLAWLEGPDPRRLAVRSATWTGVEWDASDTVARPAAGSQTGLTAAVMDDGSWLLAWSAYDGRDDEILWSLRRGGNWLAPRRLHPGNSVPDITPALIVAGDGVLAAWSRLEDGRYRTLLARYEDGSWSAPRAIGGPGSLYPSFHRFAGRPYLLLRNAFPRGWAVLELEPGGRALRQALFTEADARRPGVEAPSRLGATLRWPDEAARASSSWEVVP